MAVIQANKKKAIIKNGTNFSYNPLTFAKEHKVKHFIDTDDPQVILNNIKPYNYEGLKIISMDTETSPLDLDSNDIPQGLVRRWVGTGKSAKPQDLPFCMSFFDGTTAFSIYDSLDNKFSKFKALAPLLEDSSVDKVLHNAKFDMHMIQNIGMKIKGKIHDTVTLSKLANENRMSYMLMRLASDLKHGITKFEYMVDAYKKQHKIGSYRQIPRELMTQYANADVSNCFYLFLRDYAVIIEDELLPLYTNELKLMIALYSMERRGMRVDKDYEKPLKEELQDLATSSEQSVYDQAGRMFNMNSGKQLYEILIAVGTDPSLIKKTEKGNPKLDKKALDRLAKKHGVSFVQDILEYRKNEKLLTTYAIGIYAQADSVNKVHGGINQTEAVTGRMSVTKPALQTLPKRDKRIRSAFIPTNDDYELVFMDLD